MRYFCEQCGEDLEEGDEVVKTCFNHIIHEDCLDEYMEQLQDSFEFYEWKNDVES